MATFRVHTHNSSFETTTEVEGVEDADEAMAVGVRSALAFATDEVNEGSVNSAVDIQVEDEGGRLVIRAVVTIAVAKLSARPKIIQR